MPVRSQAAEQPSPLRPQSACGAGSRAGRGGSSCPRLALTHPWLMLPESSLSSGVPVGSPLLHPLGQTSYPPAPAPGTPPATGLLPWVLKEPPGCVGGGGGGAWIAVPAASRGEGEGKGKSREERREAPSWWRHTGGRGVLALLPLPRRDLDPQALCYRGSDKCFKARRRRGRGEKLGGEGAPFLPPRERPASGPRLPAMCPFLLWYWPAWRDIFLGRSPGEGGGGGRTVERGQRRPCLPSQVGGSGRTRRARGGAGGGALREGRDGLFSFSSVCPGEGL